MTTRSHFRFRLYIAGEAVNSALAMSNLKSLCRLRLEGQHEIEVVDVLLDPLRALTDGIYVTPTLLKLAPVPVRRIVGTLTDTPALMQALDLPELPQLPQLPESAGRLPARA